MVRLTSLTAKYVAIFVLLVAVPTIGISWYLLDSSYNDNKQALIRQQEDKARSLVLSVQQYLDRTASGLATLRGAGMTHHELDLEFQAFRDPTDDAWDQVYIDRTGRIRYTAWSKWPRPLVRRGINVAKTGSEYFGPTAGFRTAAAAGELSLRVLVLDADSTGFIGEVLGLQFLDDILGNVVLPKLGYAYALDPKGHVLSFPPRLHGPPTNYFGVGAPEPARLPFVRNALASGKRVGASTGSNVSHVKVLSAWASVPSTGWRIFVEQPESAVFASLRGKIWRTALLIAAFVLAAVALSILLARRLVRPIKRLHVAAEAIGAGAYDERIELDRKDELGALASAFNQMAARVEGLIGGLERKVAERTKALEAASKHKSEFLANMSHELRTPLNAIIGFTQVLQQKLFGEVNGKQEEYLEDIHGSANHLLALINDVLDLSKVEAGQADLEVAAFSLREALERGVVMVRERAVKNGVTLSLEPDSAVEMVEGDERRIRQVVFNLLSNAVKFTPQGGTVQVTSAQQNGEVLVSVADTGPGIALDDHERIFEEFQQTEVGQEQREGTGLGLALSRKLVELHGGRIWVESQPGQGSTFTFSLPVGAQP